MKKLMLAMSGGVDSSVALMLLKDKYEVIGATMDLGLAWEISDTLNGLMAIPNLIALLGLSGVIVEVTKSHFASDTKKPF